MKKLFVIYLGAAALLLSGCKAQPILVESMEFEKSTVKLFPGEQQEMRLNCYPSNATNLDELTTSLTDPSVADFQDGLLTAKKGGNTKLIARCGSAQATAQITVYGGWFTKGGKKYGVDKASGYYYMMGEATAQEMEITLTFIEGHEQDWDLTQNFWFTIPCDRLEQTIDFLEDMSGCMAAVYKNNNEDGYTIAYYSEELGRPVIKTADWSETEAVLTKGLLKVESQGFDRFKISADFTLSNGYTFTAQWEGSASMKKE